MRILAALVVVLVLLVAVAAIAAVAIPHFRQVAFEKRIGQHGNSLEVGARSGWVTGARSSVIALALPFLAGMFVLLLVMLPLQLRGGAPGKAKGIHEEESRMIQELHQGLDELAGRIEALETILMDKFGRG